MTPEDVAALTGPRLASWAVDYPTEQDVEIAGMLTSGQFAYASAEQQWGPWIVTENELAVGGAGFHGPPSPDGSAEIGYHLCPSYRGRGIATEVVALLADMARSGGVTRLTAGTEASNLPSQRVLERSGFARTDDSGDELRWVLALHR